MSLLNAKIEDNVMPSRSKSSNLLVRIISSAVLIPLIIWIVYSRLTNFCVALSIIAFFMAIEWRGIIRRHHSRKIAWRITACVYICTFFFSLLWLRSFPHGSNVLLWLMITVWSADTAAFGTGTLIGGPKFAPKISPSKTWSGFCGAVCASFLIGLALVSYFPIQNHLVFIATTVLLGALAQLSDLLESWVKRKAGIKDSGCLIPGHGGILDRTDSFILTAPTLALLLFFFEKFYF